MSNARRFAGWLCVALGFALVVMLGLGMIEPFGTQTSGSASLLSVLLGLLPSVMAALLVFAIGLWLLRGADKR